MSDNYDSTFLDEFGSFDEDELLRGFFENVEDEKEVDVYDFAKGDDLNVQEQPELKQEPELSPQKALEEEQPENVQPQHHQQPVYPTNNYFYPQYHHVGMPTEMMHRPHMNQQYYQPQYVYYPNQVQLHQNVHYYQPNAQGLRQPYQAYYAQPQVQQIPVRPLNVNAYPNLQQKLQYPPQPLPQFRQIQPNSMLHQGYQKSSTEILKTFEMPPTPSKLIMSAVDRDESRSTRSLEPYKIPVAVHLKPKDRQTTDEAELLELNRLQFQRWCKCVEYMKTYLSPAHELIPFIVYILEKSETSNDMIQWKERTKKFEHDRAFELKNKDEIAKAYFEVTGKQIKYAGIVTRLTKLCNIRFDGCPVFQKTKQRNTYEIFPTLIPSHDGTSCPIQIVNGLPVETDYI